MKSKLHFKWFYGVILMLGLMWTVNAHAQVSQTHASRDTTQSRNSLTRAQFNAMDEQHQLIFLNNTPFTIIDIKNATAADFVNPGPDLIFITEQVFYTALPMKQMDILHKSDIWKVYSSN